MAAAIAQAPVGPALLRVEQVTVRFGALLALDSVSLELRDGETVALAGENGAGKSTLVRCVAGDIAPTGGRILLGGARVAANPIAASRNGVAVVWQDLALCENLDVAANLLLGHERAGALRSSTRFHLAAAEMLASLGISLPDTTRPVSSLSGGQRQLLAVARAMCDRPRLLVLDEPTASLGVNESAQVEELTVKVREQGTTVLLVSHDIDQMFRLADRIAVLRHGRVVGDVAAAAVASGGGRRADLGPADQCLGAAPAQPPARPRRPPRLGRPVLEPVADPLDARGRARHRSRRHPPRGRANCCAPPAQLGLPAALVARMGRAAVRR